MAERDSTGAGLKQGHVHGATDELGDHALGEGHYVTDLHAAVLHLPGWTMVAWKSLAVNASTSNTAERLTQYRRDNWSTARIAMVGFYRDCGLPSLGGSSFCVRPIGAVAPNRLGTDALNSC